MTEKADLSKDAAVWLTDERLDAIEKYAIEWFDLLPVERRAFLDMARWALSHARDAERLAELEQTSDEQHEANCKMVKAIEEMEEECASLAESGGRAVSDVTDLSRRLENLVAALRPFADILLLLSAKDSDPAVFNAVTAHSLPARVVREARALLYDHVRSSAPPAPQGEREPGTGWMTSEQTESDIRAIEDNRAHAAVVAKDILVGAPQADLREISQWLQRQTELAKRVMSESVAAGNMAANHAAHEAHRICSAAILTLADGARQNEHDGDNRRPEPWGSDEISAYQEGRAAGRREGLREAADLADRYAGAAYEISTAIRALADDARPGADQQTWDEMKRISRDRAPEDVARFREAIRQGTDRERDSHDL
jgi:hypothetical protein